MRSSLIAIALLALAAPAALAHPERQAYFPDGSVGSVPEYRSITEQVLTVCERDSAKRIRRIFDGRLERRRCAKFERNLIYSNNEDYFSGPLAWPGDSEVFTHPSCRATAC